MKRYQHGKGQTEFVERPKKCGPIEDIHMIMDHMITSYLIFALADDPSL